MPFWFLGKAFFGAAKMRLSEAKSRAPTKRQASRKHRGARNSQRKRVRAAGSEEDGGARERVARPRPTSDFPTKNKKQRGEQNGTLCGRSTPNRFSGA